METGSTPTERLNAAGLASILPKAPGSAIIVASGSEKQVEQINDRLTGIEDAIKHFHITKSSVSPTALPGSATNSSSDSAHSEIPTPSTFEGASSFVSQAVQATHAAGSSLERLQGSADVVDALSSLQDLVQTPGNGSIKQNMRLGNPSTSWQLPDMQLLPAQFVLTLLKEFQNRASALFLAYAIRDHKQLERLCQQVYFPTNPVSLAALTFMNGMLFYLIKELLLDGTYGLCSEYDLKVFHDQAERNFQSGVETYEVLALPSLDSAKVLMLAMLKAQEEGKPLLAWTFVSTGARHVMSLGYHRSSTLENDPRDVAEDKRQVFWTFYAVDKNLALNMGYNPTMQDYDIDAEPFHCSTNPGIAPWDKAALAMIEMSKLQGLIYERLYSLQALSASPEAKAQVIDDLSLRLDRWYHEWIQVNADSAYLPTCFFLIYGAFDVVYYSVVTTLHRAATSSTSSVEISSACYEAAKKSLEAHLHFFPAFQSYGDAEILVSYVAWILLYASWTPLIVVFLHAIASSSPEDVRLLEQTEESLEPLKNLNPQSEQVYSLCRTFCKLSKAFVQRPSTFVGTYNSQEDMIVMPQPDLYERNPNSFAVPPSDQHANAAQWEGLQPGIYTPQFDGSDQIFWANWLGNNQPVANLWNMDFTQNLE